MSGDWYRCPDCKVERTDAEEEYFPASTAGGIAQDAGMSLHHLDECPNCGSEAFPEKAGTWET